MKYILLTLAVFVVTTAPAVALGVKQAVLPTVTTVVPYRAGVLVVQQATLDSSASTQSADILQ
jgi:hypothetical protein